MGKLEQYEGLLLTITLTSVGYLVYQINTMKDDLHKTHVELLGRLAEDSVRIEKVSGMVQLQAQDVNNTINRKIDALEQRLPPKP